MATCAGVSRRLAGGLHALLSQASFGSGPGFAAASRSLAKSRGDLGLALATATTTTTTATASAGPRGTSHAPPSSGREEGSPGTSRAYGSARTEKDSASTTYDVGCSSNIRWHESPVTRDARERQLDQRGCVLWMTGLSGSGKSTVAFTLEHLLQEKGKVCYVLDGDNVRHGLCKDLGFTRESREENIRRMGEVAKLMANAGIVTVVSIISPFAEDRDRVRSSLGADFHEVYVKVPLSVCEERDPKGLYRKVREGKIKGFTGVDSPYEAPRSPEVTLEAATGEPADMAKELYEYLEEKGLLKF